MTNDKFEILKQTIHHETLHLGRLQAIYAALTGQRYVINGKLPKPGIAYSISEWWSFVDNFAEHQACEAEWRHDALTDR